MSASARSALEKMRARGVDARAVRTFEHYWNELAAGAQGVVHESEIAPLDRVPELDDVECTEEEAREALTRTAIVKLNGGLGTSMGMTGPKSALVVHDGLSFLDLTARQVRALRHEHGVEVPLVLMNSFRTRAASLEILGRYPDLAVEGVPADFLQNAEPKLRADDLEPVEWPADPDLEWCPPGHGDVYVALAGSGLLDALRERGVRYAFISNADNLGATCDPTIAAWLHRESIPFAMEICERTRNDRKGGHVARRMADDRLVLREIAMVADGEEELFQDTSRHRYFNTNSIWIDLDVLAAVLDDRDGVLGLPIVVNRKTVDPSDAASTPVIQIESAMGSAIESFDGARVVEVPRTRFRPVKTTNELLLLRSDVFEVDEHGRVHGTSERPDPKVSLSSAYKLVRDFEARFPHGAPSLRRCDSLTVEGDVVFGAGVECVGDVVVVGDGRIADGAVLQGRVEAAG